MLDVQIRDALEDIKRSELDVRTMVIPENIKIFPYNDYYNANKVDVRTGQFLPKKI